MDDHHHNLDSTPEFYRSIISTRAYQDRLDTLANVRQAGIKVCSGGHAARQLDRSSCHRVVTQGSLTSCRS